ncbi:hypothetical protein [Sphingomonas radiodurans]|uniref:hypothetical protein n=1 Tax=Sphingomonas radiodurans TaxID=2890321 RepID=UPI001E4434A8|nr:hypothetical protein [Sphingomonas radiodurans]WBH17821.1 hypothetical protein LLW23_06895 [Sphingomonas radiodurans]
MAEGKWRALRQRIARDGLPATLRKAIGDHVFRHSASVVMELRREDARLGPVRADGSIRFVILRDDDEVPPLCPFLAHRRRDFIDSLAIGKLGFFVLRHEIAVGCAWVALSDHHDSRMRERYRVAPGEAYLYSWLLDPVERPRGTALMFARWVMQVLLGMAVERMFCVIDRDNRASYRIHQHFRYRESGLLVRHFHLLHLRWTLMSRYKGTLGLRDPARGRRAA